MHKTTYTTNLYILIHTDHAVQVELDLQLSQVGGEACRHQTWYIGTYTSEVDIIKDYFNHIYKYVYII